MVRLIKEEFKVNENITLKLENNNTFIYINGESFMQYIHLVLQITKYQFSNYDQINSIDEASEIYKNLNKNMIFEGGEHNITPDQEFWGHCSNLQLSYEND